MFSGLSVTLTIGYCLAVLPILTLDSERMCAGQMCKRIPEEQLSTPDLHLRRRRGRDNPTPSGGFAAATMASRATAPQTSTAATATITIDPSSSDNDSIREHESINENGYDESSSGDAGKDVKVQAVFDPASSKKETISE